MRIEGERPSRRLISLTPLIDVVFILLVFFMLASSFTEWRTIHLNMPADTGASTGAVSPLIVLVRRDGRLELNDEILSQEDLVQRLTLVLRNDPDRPVLINPEEGTTLGKVVDVLNQLAANGIENITLMKK